MNDLVLSNLSFMKKFSIMLSALCLAAGTPAVVQAQSADFTLDQTVPANPDNEPRPVFPVPSARQLAWNQTGFYAFFHYGMNTYLCFDGFIQLVLDGPPHRGKAYHDNCGKDQ